MPRQTLVAKTSARRQDRFERNWHDQCFVCCAGVVEMTVDQNERLSKQLTIVQLALQLLVRRQRPWDQQRRIASMALASLRRLAAMMLSDKRPT
jgi:hypothetical protein